MNSILYMTSVGVCREITINMIPVRNCTSYILRKITPAMWFHESKIEFRYGKKINR